MKPPSSHRRLRALAGLLLVGVVSLSAVACGSDAASTPSTASTAASSRQASDVPNADGVCPEARSIATSVRISNLLPSAVTFRVPIDEITCADWSGVSTPYTAFNRQSVAPSEVRSFRLELRKSAERGAWTMGMRTVGTYGEAEGTARFEVQDGAFFAVDAPRYAIPADAPAYPYPCGFSPIAPAPEGWRDTPEINFQEFRYTNAVAAAVRDGKVGYFWCPCPTCGGGIVE